MAILATVHFCCDVSSSGKPYLRRNIWGLADAKATDMMLSEDSGEGEQFSERSDAGTSIVQEVFGFVKENLSGA